MKKFNKISVVGVLAVVFTLSLSGPMAALGATAPSLGNASTFSVLAGLSMSAAGAGTTISGNLGLSPGLAVSKTGPWTVGGTEYFGVGGLSATAQAAALGAFNNLVGQGSSGAWSLNANPVPGVWTTAASATFPGPTLTLDGGYDDVWVFQIGADFTFTGSVVLTGDAQPCNVFWQVGGDATIASGSTFIGTLIASGDVTVVSGATVNGRVISLNSSLTTDGNVISGPTCAAAPIPVVPAPAPAAAVGTSYYFAPLPLINITKIPSPLSLPSGPGSVTYTYTVTNPGVEKMIGIWVTDDKCSPVEFVSGDANNDSKLDVNESWIYRCTTTVNQTVTNTATTHGQSSGGDVYDTANATVVVGVPLTPPLIHLVKKPSVFVLPAAAVW